MDPIANTGTGLYTFYMTPYHAGEYTLYVTHEDAGIATDGVELRVYDLVERCRNEAEVSPLPLIQQQGPIRQAGRQ